MEREHNLPPSACTIICRTFAQLVVLELLERFPDGCGVESSAHLAAAGRFLAGNADLQRLRGSIGGAVSSFQPDVAASPRGVFLLVRGEGYPRLP